MYYDIVYPRKGQLTLLCNNQIIANSKSKAYLRNRMCVFQDELCEIGLERENTYVIVDMQNNCILETHIYKVGEKGEGKKRKPQGRNIKFLEIEPIRPTKYSQCYVVVDEENKIISDLDLLGDLYDFRFYQHLPCETSNKTLAFLAAYPPETKDQLIDCYGFGAKMYEKCGERILEFFKNRNDQ